MVTPRLFSDGRIEAAVAAILAFLVFFVGTSATPLIGQDEARFAQAAREMKHAGELVVPTFGGQPRYDKPILIYWLTMAGYALFGVGERVARLPSNLAAALLVGLLAWWARRRWGPASGLLTALLLVASPVVFIEARACTADFAMMLPTVVAMLAMERLVNGEGDLRTALTFWAAMGFAVLAKGPIGPTVAAATGVALWAFIHRWQRWHVVGAAVLVVLGYFVLGPLVLVLPLLLAFAEALASDRLRPYRFLVGVPLMVLIVVPWAAAAHLATEGDFFREAIGRHVIDRSVSALESHGGFPGFYLATALIGALPWFPALLGRLRRSTSSLLSDSTTRFLLAWALGPLVVLELMQTRMVHYWMPCYPAGVLLVVAWLRSPVGRRESLGPVVSSISIAAGLILAALPVVAAVVLELPDLLPIAVATAVPLAVGAMWMIGWRHRVSARRAVAAYASSCLVFLIALVTVFFPRLAPNLIVQRSVERVMDLWQPGETLVLYKVRDDELFFDLPFGAVNCPSAGDLADRLSSGRPFLGVARVADLDRFADHGPEFAWSFDLVESVDGVDLAKGRWTAIALFRPRPTETSSFNL